ncbi:MAG: type II toxin-antitoxin system prevent-host-death family antitoxin [Pseudomonadota bacterium]
MHDPTPRPARVSTTRARQNLSTLIKHAQHPKCFVVLTHHGAPAAALVSMVNLKRIFNAEDVERVVAGTHRRGGFCYSEVVWGKTDRETAEGIQRLQIDRMREREMLARHGLEEIPGGEIRGEVQFVPYQEPLRIAPPVRFWPLAVWWRVRGWLARLVKRGM